MEYLSPNIWHGECPWGEGMVVSGNGDNPNAVIKTLADHMIRVHKEDEEKAYREASQLVQGVYSNATRPYLEDV